MTILPSIDTKEETARITKFIQETLKKTGSQKVILGISGGIDSATTLYLLKKAILPENIVAVHMPYNSSVEHVDRLLKDTAIPEQNIHTISIRELVEPYKQKIDLTNENIRVGNIMARTRMILLYDLAKKLNGLVAGTENKSEYYLGYFTRFGDEASDFEPIRYLYKTQVWELAKSLGVPQYVIDQTPTAGLWQGQTDEKEFGFTYEEADQVLYLYFEKKEEVEELEERGFTNAKKIIERANQNDFKHQTPYILGS